MSQVKFEFVKRNTEVAEKNVPVLHIHVPAWHPGDFVVRKATEQDKEIHKEAYEAFLASQPKG